MKVIISSLLVVLLVVNLISYGIAGPVKKTAEPITAISAVSLRRRIPDVCR